MKKERISLPAIGGVSLLVIFAVLCQVVFALISFSTAQADQNQADHAAQAVSEYYAAELEAQKIFARLQSGETVDSVAVDGNTYRYSCPISEQQILEVELQKEGDTWTICRWQVMVDGVPIDEALPVWNGEKEG